MNIKPIFSTPSFCSNRLLLTALFVILFFLTIHSQPMVQWSEGYGGTKNDIPHAAKELPNGEFILVGQSISPDTDVTNPKGGFDGWVTQLDANGNLLWEKNYGGSQEDYLMDIQLTTDGGYVMTGGTSSSDGDLATNAGKVDVWVLKTNALGVVQWSKNFGGSRTDFGTSIQVLSDGYMVAGCTGSAGENGISAGYGKNEFWVLKLDLNGNLLWEKTYGGRRHDAAKRILPTTDGGFLVAGNTWSKDGDVNNHKGHGDAWVIKISANGTLQWSKTYGTNTADRLTGFTQTTDGNYVLAGAKSEMDFVSPGLGGRYDEQFWLLKISPSGQQVWEKNFGGEKYDAATSINATADGGVIAGGAIRSSDGIFTTNQGNQDAWLLKTNTAGSTEWSQLFGGSENETPQSVLETNDGGFLMLASSNSIFISSPFAEFNGLEDFWAVKLEGSGASINVDLGVDLTVCVGEEFTLDAYVSNCNCTYSWSDGNMDATRQLNISQTTTFTVTVTDNNNQQAIDAITVTVSQPQITDNIQNVLCHGAATGAIQITPQGNGYAYNWNNSLTTSSIANLESGTYTLTVTDNNTCSITESFTITQPDEIVIDETVQNASCFGNDDGSITTIVDGGEGSYNFLWSNAADTPNISQLSSGTYTLTVTDGNMCEQIKEIVVSQNTNIVVSSQITPTTCFDSMDGAIDITASGGVGGFSFAWNSGQDSEDVNTLLGGDYIVTITDGNGCEAVKLYTVPAPDEIEIAVNATDVSCFGGTDGSFDLTVQGGTPPLAYLFGSSGNDNLPAGNYPVTVMDANSCNEDLFVTITQPDSFFLTLQTVNPINGNDGSITVQSTGGTPPYDYDWNNGTWMTSEITNLSGGTYDLILTDANDCILNASVLLETIGTFEIENLQTFEIFPNPNDGTFFLKIEFEKRQQTEVLITNELGQLVQQYQYNTDFILEKNTRTNLSAGVYFVLVKTEDGVAAKRLIIQN